MRRSSMSFSDVIVNLNRPFGSMWRVFLFQPYPIFGILTAPLYRRRTGQSMPRGLRHDAKPLPPMRWKLCAWKRVNLAGCFFTILTFLAILVLWEVESGIAAS